MAVVLAACGGGHVPAELPESMPAASPAAIDKGDRLSPFAALPANTVLPADAATAGFAGPLMDWPLVAVHAVLNADGRVLSYGTTESGAQTGNFNYAVWNPTDNSHLTLPNTSGVDIFCGSQLMLVDGSQAFLAGGDNWNGTRTTNTGNRDTTLIDFGRGEIRRSDTMHRSRWYASSTMLTSGEILVQGGNGGADFPEVRQLDGRFRLLNGSATGSMDWWYPRNFVAPDGRVFGFDSRGRMYFLDPRQTGSITPAGQLPAANIGSDASAAMFAPGRILQFGGNSNQAVVIDITSGTPAVRQTGSMLRQRRLGTATLLADGQVLATGGSRVWNELTDVSRETEIWNPRTGQWSVGATLAKPRLYHGNALLLPDASVIVFGGGAPGPIGAGNNLDAEIYYPPYLFDENGWAARPVIEQAPTVVDTGRTVRVTVKGDRPIARMVLVKTGAATHGFNMDQRFVELPFDRDGSQLAVQIPASAGEVPPGLWMLFALDNRGTPSRASILRVNVAGTLNVATQPVFGAIANQIHTIGLPAVLDIQATDPNRDPLRFTATGLPAGLAIDPGTGRVSGTPRAVGIFPVTVAVSDGINSATRSFTWTLNAPLPLTLATLGDSVPASVGSEATFTASAGGNSVMYRWDFGDGTPPTAWSESGTIRRSFARAGSYFVTVTARDAFGHEERRSTLHTAHLPITSQLPAASTPIAVQVLGGGQQRIWVVNPDQNSVSAFDASTRQRVAEIAVGVSPQSVVPLPSGEIWVSNRDSASISVIDGQGMTLLRTIDLARASRPHGMTSANGGESVLVVLEATGELVRIDAATRRVTSRVAVGPDARQVSVASDGHTAYVSRFITPPLPGEATLQIATARQERAVGGELVMVDVRTMTIGRTIVLGHSNVPDSERSGGGVPNYLGAAAISPDGTQAFVPSKQDNVLRGQARDGRGLNFQNTVRAVTSRIDLTTGLEDLPARLDHDNSSVASAAAFDPLGAYLFVALETSREVAVIDAHQRQEILRIDTGLAPQGLVVSPDRRTLYVMNYMDRTLGIHDLSGLVLRGAGDVPVIAMLPTVAHEKLPATVLRGKQLFYDARDPRLARDRYMSCASCHRDGGHDGRVWDISHLGEGLRRTPSLRGKAGMGAGALHWSGNFDEVQDFEGQIRDLAGGVGLLEDAAFAPVRQAMGAAKSGLSKDLDALAAYVSSLDQFEPSAGRRADGSLTVDAVAGRSIFSNLQCASCHGGAFFTASAFGLGLQDVGTIKASSGRRAGTTLQGLRTPTLRNLSQYRQYLHDGSAPTVADAVRAHRGVTSEVLAAADPAGSAAGATIDARARESLRQLSAYLLELGAEEPPAMTARGLRMSYFAGAVGEGLPLALADAGAGQPAILDFAWIAGGSIPVPSQGDFSVRLEGHVRIARTGDYVLRIRTQSGAARLWVGGQAVALERGVSRALRLHEGREVDLRIEYVGTMPGAQLQVDWQAQQATSGNPAGFEPLPVDALDARPAEVVRPQWTETAAPKLMQGEAVSVDLRARSAFGDGLIYRAEGLPPGLRLVATGADTARIEGRIDATAAPGTRDVTLIAQDPAGASAEVRMAWTVEAAPLPPPTVAPVSNPGLAQPVATSSASVSTSVPVPAAVPVIASAGAPAAAGGGAVTAGWIALLMLAVLMLRPSLTGWAWRQVVSAGWAAVPRTNRTDSRLRVSLSRVAFRQQGR